MNYGTYCDKCKAVHSGSYSVKDCRGEHHKGCMWYRYDCSCDKLPADSVEDALDVVLNGCGVAENEGLWDEAWSRTYYGKDQNGPYIKIEHLETKKTYRLRIEEVK